MKIRDILGQGRPTISFEVFPPKTAENYEAVKEAALEIAALKPAFMSVTYGAGGGTSRYTVDIASALQEQGKVTPLAHLTCVSSTREKVHQVLGELKGRGIENVLALRGDIPADGRVEHDYRYASELIREIKEAGDFCVGAACYPEGHVESVNKADDIKHLKENRQTADRYQVAFWSKVFYPLAIFVMLAVAMPFAYLNARSGGVSIKIFAGLMIGISFYALNNIFSFLGVLNTWHPMVVAVVPTSVMLICASIALWLLERR